jgi:hypothetical protein
MGYIEKDEYKGIKKRHLLVVGKFSINRFKKCIRYKDLNEL